MKKRLLLHLIILVLALTVLPHCGGGGGGGGGNNNNNSGGPTTAVLTLSAAITGIMPPNTTIDGYDVTITLPAGVTINSTTPPSIDGSVLTYTGGSAGTNIAGSYAPAAGGTPGTAKIIVANANGISAGEFCKVTCNIPAGSNPSFAQPTFAVSGLVTSPSVSTVDLTGVVTMTVTAVIK